MATDAPVSLKVRVRCGRRCACEDGGGEHPDAPVRMVVASHRCACEDGGGGGPPMRRWGATNAPVSFKVRVSRGHRCACEDGGGATNAPVRMEVVGGRCTGEFTGEGQP